MSHSFSHQPKLIKCSPFSTDFVFEIIMDLKETAEITERAHVSFIRLPWVIASSVPTVLYQTQ